ncbi:MAG TPA: hypothetical protein PLO96_07835 [Candidatus Cloacimonas acidaminovorans]|nr:hypothetical protein [Candidatus Cloacimonas acidaminovorans]
MKKSLFTIVLALFVSANFSTVWNVNNISGIAAYFNDLLFACNCLNYAIMGLSRN